MPTLKLTKRAVDAILPTDKVCYYFDSELPGFFLRVMPSNVRAWGFEYRAGSGRQAPKRRITIASYGKVTPEEARAAARNHSATVTKGGDPAAAKKARSREMTVAALIDLYAEEGCFIQRGARQGEPMKERTKAYTLARLRHHVLPLIGSKRVSEVGAAEIERLVRDIGTGKTSKDEKIGPRVRIIVRGGDGAARKVVRDLSAVFSFAARRNIISSNPCDIAAVRKTDNRRERYLSLEEVTKLGAAFDALEAEGVNSKAINIARLWALTGCRRDEIAGLRWSEVDVEEGLLRFADSKTGRSVRPLGVAARVLLESLLKGRDGEFVFPAERGATHYQGTKRIWPKVVVKAGLSGVTPHTLRHTIGSTAVSHGEALALTGAILGHSNIRSTAIYAHVQYDSSRRAADRVSQQIDGALKGHLLLTE